MAHANARLTVHGRLLLVQRVRKQGWAVAHAARAMGISRQCAHRWLNRYDKHGVAGLGERSSRPRTCPHRTPAQVKQQILDCRRRHRRGQDWIAGELALAPRTVSRVLRRAGEPYLRCLDPMTGEVIRSSKATATRYERGRPGELVHVDVKKLGRIPDGGGWRAHGRAASGHQRDKKVKIGYDYVHSMVDDHSRLAYSEIHDDEKVQTCAGFLTPGRGLLRRPRHRQHRAGHDRQRLRLPPRPRVHRRRRRHRGGPEVHQTALPLAERQGRAVQPHPADRMGLPVRLHQQPGPT